MNIQNHMACKEYWQVLPGYLEEKIAPNNHLTAVYKIHINLDRMEMELTEPLVPASGGKVQLWAYGRDMRVWNKFIKKTALD